jgi:ABC-type phosphate/phosphonate transport system substrate-binding protein
MLVVEKYFGKFHKRLERNTGCAVRYRIQKDFEYFIESMFKREYTIVLVPGPYFNVLKQLDYIAVSSQILSEPRHSYVVAKKEKGISNLMDLKGHKVVISSPFASSGSFFLQALKTNGLSNDVQVEGDYSYDRMVMDVLKNKADAAVLIEEFWALMDPRLRDTHLNVVAKLKSDASTEFLILKEQESLAPHVLTALQASLLKWGKPAENAHGSASLEALLIEKLANFEKKHANF